MMTNADFYSMTLHELSSWVVRNNTIRGVTMFDELPGVDELDDDEETAARDEYEAMAEQLAVALALSPEAFDAEFGN